MIEVKGYVNNIVAESVVHDKIELQENLSKSVFLQKKTTLIPDLEKTLCSISPDKTLIYYPMYKNASTFITDNLEHIGWKRGVIDLSNMPTVFTVLRDPYERWVSGFVQEIKNTAKYGDNNTREILLNDINGNSSIILDFVFSLQLFTYGLATELQSNFPLDRIPNNKIVFFKHGSNLNFKLYHWLLGKGFKTNFLNAQSLNVSSNDILYNKILCYLTDKKNQEAKSKLIEHLAPDYQLINSITFF
jgi:hypothetical protein